MPSSLSNRLPMPRTVILGLLRRVGVSTNFVYSKSSTFRRNNVNGASQTGVEGADNAPQLKRLVLILYPGTDKGLFHRPGLSVVVLRRHIPGAWHHTLVIGNFLIFYLNPVPQSTSGTVKIGRAHS